MAMKGTTMLSSSDQRIVSEAANQLRINGEGKSYRMKIAGAWVLAEASRYDANGNVVEMELYVVKGRMKESTLVLTDGHGWVLVTKS